MNTTVREGEVLAGKYRVDRVLGVGGMGIVVAAQHLELDDRVAIKFLLPETLGNAEAVARFAREARAAVKIKSEHVARVSDVGKLENGAPYMVMEYLQGSDLSGWLSEKGALPIEQAVEFTLQASEALAEAHSLGIVHRDLKPANLFVIRRPDGGLSIKVLDFGISKMSSIGGGSGDGSMTKTSAIMGSPIYMSPEQIQSSKDVDSRGDIWALGVILFELITGHAPFGGEHMAELIYRIISTPPPPLGSYRTGVPPELERVIFRCLEKDRGQRFASIAELARALLPFAPARAAVSVERIAGVMTGGYPAADAQAHALVAQASTNPDKQTVPFGGVGTEASWGQTHAGKQRTPWFLLGGAALLVTLTGAVITVRHFAGSASAPSAVVASPQPEPPEVKPQPPVAPSIPSPSVAPSASAPATPSASAASSAAASPTQKTGTLSSKPASQSARAVPQTPPASSKKPPRSSDPWGEGQR